VAKNSTWGKPLQAGNNGKQQQQPKQKPKDSADLQSGYEASGDEHPFTKVMSRGAGRRERKRLREESGLQSAAEAAETSSDERKDQPKRNRKKKPAVIGKRQPGATAPNGETSTSVDGLVAANQCGRPRRSRTDHQEGCLLRG